MSCCMQVTVANILHRKGKSDSYIQTRLRWKSTTFLDNLHNTIYVADVYNELTDIPDENLPVLTDKQDQNML